WAGVSSAKGVSRPRTELNGPDVRMGGPDARPTMNDLAYHGSTAANGELDSSMRRGTLFLHAVGGNFNPGPAADAAVWMEWLASHSNQPDLVERLNRAATNALSQVAVADWSFAGVGHIRYPLASLLYGHVAENAMRAREKGR